MLFRAFVAATILFLLPPAALRPARGSDPTPVLVFSASSVSEAVQAIGTAFTRKTGIPVRINSGGSGTLAQQILKGAPADVFVSAGEGPMAPLIRTGLVNEGSSFHWISNRLVVVAPSDRATPLTGPERIAGREVRHLAVGDPASVPVGHYAHQSLTALGLWDRLQGRLVHAPDARTALAYVESGEADLGIVYATDARITSKVRIVLELPEETHVPIRYPVALVANPDRSAGTRPFLDFLRSPEARRILTAFGFTPVFP